MGLYKKEIINSLKWFDENKETEFITNGNGYVIINAQDKIRSTMIGTIASILSKSNNVEVKFIMSMAQIADGTTKVSLRMKGRKNELDLREIIMDMTKKIPGCEAGGHANAAGALIPTDMEDKFIEEAKLILDKKAMEEVV